MDNLNASMCPTGGITTQRGTSSFDFLLNSFDYFFFFKIG